jgi:hypothetical protein
MQVRIHRPSPVVFWVCLLLIGIPLSAFLVWLWVRVTGAAPRRAGGGTILAIGVVVSWVVSVVIHIRRLHAESSRD